mgnify:CR=1 FL=1
MPVFKSQLDPRSADFKANTERMRALVADLREKVAKIAIGGDEAARQKHVSRGKLLARTPVRTALAAGPLCAVDGQRTPFLLAAGAGHSCAAVCPTAPRHGQPGTTGAGAGKGGLLSVKGEPRNWDLGGGVT